MTQVKIACYKGPTSSLFHWITHWLTILVLSIRKRRWHPYSHIEVVILDTCYSSSLRDGGVRSKVIDLNTGKWDIFDDPKTKPALALSIFNLHKGRKYDITGAGKWWFKFLPERKDRDYCIEICAAMRGMSDISNLTIMDIVDDIRV
jgi:hypothetical protein